MVNPLRALLIEDDLDLLAAVAEALQREGLRVIAISDASSDSLRSVVDVIVMDQQLGSTTGLELLARLRREGQTAPTILATAYADEATKAAARGLDACQVLEKPFSLEALLEAIERAVATSSGPEPARAPHR